MVKFFHNVINKKTFNEPYGYAFFLMPILKNNKKTFDVPYD